MPTAKLSSGSVEAPVLSEIRKRLPRLLHDYHVILSPEYENRQVACLVSELYIVAHHFHIPVARTSYEHAESLRVSQTRKVHRVSPRRETRQQYLRLIDGIPA